MIFSPDPRKDSAAASAVKNFRATGYEPEGYTLYTYGAIQAWVQAVTKAGSTDTGKVIASLRKNKVRHRSRQNRFRHEGRRDRAWVCFLRVENGTYDYVN